MINTILKTIRNKRIKIRFISTLLLLSFCFIGINTYADATTPSTYDLTRELTSSEEAELKNFDTLTKMMDDIFSFNTEYGDSTINNTSSLLYELLEDALVKWDDFTKSTVYRYVQGLALLFLMIAFMIKIYEDNQENFEGEMVTKEMIRSMVYFVFALLVLILLKYYVQFILAFFRFLLDRIISLKDSSDLGVVEDLTSTIKPKTIAYYILQDSGLVGSSSLIEEVSIRSKEASLRSMYMFPWILTWISKVGELIVIFINSTLLIIYGTFFPIALYDVFDDLKKSNFLAYGKHFTSIAVEEILIVAIVYIGNLFLNPYINRILNNIAGGSSNLSFVSMAIVVVAAMSSKFILLVLTFPLSRKLMGTI